MVKGEINQQKVDVDYRKIDALNYSSIKTFLDDGVGIFYKEYILKEKKEKWTPSLVIGTLIDDIIINYRGDMTAFYQNFDNKYCQLNENKSSAQVFLLADYLFEELSPSIKDGKITGNFEIAFQNSFDRIQKEGKYKGKTIEQGLSDFNTNGKDYFNLKLHSINKIMVDLQQISIAERTANKLLRDETTGRILKGVLFTIPKIVVVTDFMGITIKVEIDLTEINHEEKWLQPYDLKNVFDNEDFDYSYIKYRYYLQAALYKTALTLYAEKEFPGYEVRPFKFIVGDTSANNRKPLIYSLSEEDERYALSGFHLNGREYKGLVTLLSEIKWHIENDVWDCSMEAFINEGLLNLNINYDD